MKTPKVDNERGSATVEFLGGTLLVLLPIIYLILTFADVQAATYAAESAARQSSRIYARAATEPEALAASRQATTLAFYDHAIEIDASHALSITCQSDPCLSPGAGIHAEVQVEVPLPFIPDFIVSRLPTSLTVKADAFATVDRFSR